MKQIIFVVLASMIAATAALADSCWDHNGSLMRLKAEGNQRFFYYEQPREGMRRAGVVPGQILFNGRTDGTWYQGTARVFDRQCNRPLTYFVEGPVMQGPLRVIVSGLRPVHKNCSPTGENRYDQLVFEYVGNC